jgi:hypothetical protein
MSISAIQDYTRLMARVFTDLETIPVFTFFQNLFTSGQTIIEVDANAIDIDIQRGNKKLAVYIPRGTDAVNSSSNRAMLEKFTSDTKLFPLIEELTPITSDMIAKRMPGEPVYAPLSRQAKQIALAMKAHWEHMNRIIRKMELSAAESIRTGFQTIHSGLSYDFYRRATHNATVATVWSDSAGATPITDFSNVGDLIFRNGNRRPTDIIFSSESWDEFLNTAQITTLANNRRIVHFTADMTIDAPAGYDDWVRAGAVFQGQVKAGDWKFNMWTYPAIYETDAGVATQYLPDGEVIVLAKGARYDRYFGPADRLEVDTSIFQKMFGLGDISGMPPNVVESGIFSSAMFHVDAYGNNNNKAFNVRTQVAPIFPTTEIDTIVKLAT